jgi:hypothetical protein
MPLSAYFPPYRFFISDAKWRRKSRDVKTAALLPLTRYCIYLWMEVYYWQVRLTFS